VTSRLGAISLVLACSAPLPASAQTSAVAPSSLARVREGVERPVVRNLAPSAPVRLRPTYRARVDQRVFVRTLEEDLHKTFDMNDLQRQSAAWAARCCGIDLGRVFRGMQHVMDEHRTSKVREQIARELAELKAANAGAK